jgi:hypothetical protein
MTIWYFVMILWGVYYLALINDIANILSEIKSELSALKDHLTEDDEW